MLVKLSISEDLAWGHWIDLDSRFQKMPCSPFHTQWLIQEITLKLQSDLSVTISNPTSTDCNIAPCDDFTDEWLLKTVWTCETCQKDPWGSSVAHEIKTPFKTVENFRRIFEDPQQYQWIKKQLKKVEFVKIKILIPKWSRRWLTSSKTCENCEIDWRGSQLDLLKWSLRIPVRSVEMILEDPS
jgi:hypothetical protein